MDQSAEVVELEQSVEQVGRVAAIDIANASAMVCTRLPSARNPDRRVQRTFAVASTTDAIAGLAGQLAGLRVQLVVMEATGDYWRPFFYLLQDQGLTVWLVNARDVKNVPGRPKTDKLDAIWLAKLAERGMLRASFVPPAPVRELRDLTRLRRTLTEERARHRNRIEKVLQDACIKLSDKHDGLSDLFGVSGRAILAALVAGQRDPAALAEPARGQVRKKIPFLRRALAGRFTDHHGYQIEMLPGLHDGLTERIEELTGRIEAAIAAIDPTAPPDPDHPDRMALLDRLDQIPGVGRDTAAEIIAETGVDMTVFPTPGHLASRAKLTPRTVQSGARSGHGGTGKGNRWLKCAPAQAALNAGRTKTFPGARYRRIVKRAPKNKAQVAVARNIIEVFWFLIEDPDVRFADPGPNWHTRHIDTARKTRQAVRDLEHLGYTVTLTQAA